MTLRHRLGRGNGAAAPGQAPLLAVRTAESEPDRYQVIKKQLHRELIAKLDLAMLEGLDENQRRGQVENLARRMLVEAEIRLTRGDEEQLITELLHDTFDLGPITPLLLDEEISDILVTGGTGSGKTTLLNILSRYIPSEERIVTIEDSAELMLQQPHVVRLETRPPNIEGKGQINQRDLVRNALRMRPDRIVVGEVRGDECLAMLQAMNTGHDGSMTTIHSNGPRDALHRVENLVLMAGHQLHEKAIRGQIASALELIVHVSRLADGTRRILSVQELMGMEGNVVTMQE